MAAPSPRTTRGWIAAVRVGTEAMNVMLGGFFLLSDLKRGPLTHVLAVMSALVAGIHFFKTVRGTPKTWMAGSRPGHDAIGGRLVEGAPRCA